MKIYKCIVFTVFFVFFISSLSFADSFILKGREISAGKPTSEGVEGALFVGNFFNERGKVKGYFILTLDHSNELIEICNPDPTAPEGTELIKFKLVMKFNYGGRIVLVGPKDEDKPIKAVWAFDDPDHPDGNWPLLGYADYIDPSNPGLVKCDDSLLGGDPDVAYVAQVERFNVAKQWWGSYLTPYREGTVSGFLDHTPIISPAIVGVITLE